MTCTQNNISDWTLSFIFLSPSLSFEEFYRMKNFFKKHFRWKISFFFVLIKSWWHKTHVFISILIATAKPESIIWTKFHNFFLSFTSEKKNGISKLFQRMKRPIRTKVVERKGSRLKKKLWEKTNPKWQANSVEAFTFDSSVHFLFIFSISCSWSFFFSSKNVYRCRIPTEKQLWKIPIELFIKYPALNKIRAFFFDIFAIISSSILLLFLSLSHSLSLFLSSFLSIHLFLNFIFRINEMNFCLHFSQRVFLPFAFYMQCLFLFIGFVQSEKKQLKSLETFYEVRFVVPSEIIKKKKHIFQRNTNLFLIMKWWRKTSLCASMSFYWVQSLKVKWKNHSKRQK